MNRLADLAKTASEKDCEQMLDELESFRDTAEITDDAQQRILSSVMKKAGFEMNNAIRMNKRNDRINTTDNTELNTVRRGRHLLAACIALALIAGTAGAVIFGGRLDREPVKPQPQSDSGAPQTEELKERKVQEWAKPYIEQNPETVGYLKIAGLIGGGDLETPVVQHEDNEFYSSHGFDMKENEAGTIMADCYVPIDEKGQPSNIVLYGQNMREHTELGFTSLLQYMDSEDFFREHSVINFSTVYDEQDTEYQIFACFVIDVNEEYDPDNGAGFFDYWRYRNFDEEHSFDRWINEINDRAIYKTDISCTENDDYLSMSVAGEMNENVNERFVLVAKKITHGDEKQDNGSRTAVIPEVQGLSDEEAKKAIEDAGFVPVRCETYEIYENVKEGAVAKTDPGCGTELAEGSEVRYYVSRGPINFDILEKDELIKVVYDLYDMVMEKHCGTIADFNAAHGTQETLQKPEEDFTWDYIRELGLTYEAMIKLSSEQMTDYLTKTSAEGSELAVVPDVRWSTEEEAVAKLSEAGFVPYRYGTDTTCASEGRVSSQTEPEGVERYKGTLIGYSTGRVDERIKAVPDYDGDTYEDDELSVKVKKLMCDGSFFFVEYTMENKTGTWRDILRKYFNNIHFADNGELYEIYYYLFYDREVIDENTVNVIVGYAVTPEMLSRGVFLDIYDQDEYGVEGEQIVAKSGKKDRPLSISLECNLPTRTLTSEDGISLTLSPMGISIQNYDGKIKDLQKTLGNFPYIVYVTKDGSRIDGNDYYPSEALHMESRDPMQILTDDSFFWGFFAYRDIESIDSVEINGIEFR